MIKTYLQEVSHDDMVSFILFKYIKEQIFDTNRRIFFTTINEEKMFNIKYKCLRNKHNNYSSNNYRHHDGYWVN